MKKKIFATIILTVISCSFMCCSYASSVSDLQGQKGDIQDAKNDAKKELEEIEGEKDEALSEIEELNNKITSSETEIADLKKQINNLEDEIEQTEKDLKKAEEDYAERKKMLETRIIAQYMAGKTTYLDVLLNSKSFSSFISKYYMIGVVAKCDNELLNQIEEEQKRITKEKESLEQKKTEVKTAKANMEKTNVILKNAKAQKNSKVAALTEEQKSLEEKIKQYDKEMSDLEAQIRAAQSANSGSGNTTYTGGKLGWPVPSSTKITSYYGMRMHPIYKVPKLHAGIDIGGADWGAPFVAAEDGIVIKAEYYGGYGNCVIIDHGGGITTLYGHGSAIYVTKGQKVKKGQSVLAIGSSGTSTGKHAHFEVRVNGSPVNPLPYLTK